MPSVTTIINKFCKLSVLDFLGVKKVYGNQYNPKVHQGRFSITMATFIPL